MLTSFARL